MGKPEEEPVAVEEDQKEIDLKTIDRPYEIVKDLSLNTGFEVNDEIMVALVWKDGKETLTVVKPYGTPVLSHKKPIYTPINGPIDLNTRFNPVPVGLASSHVVDYPEDLLTEDGDLAFPSQSVFIGRSYQLTNGGYFRMANRKRYGALVRLKCEYYYGENFDEDEFPIKKITWETLEFEADILQARRQKQIQAQKTQIN